MLDEARQEALQARSAELARAFKALFDSPDGEIVLGWFMDTCHVTSSTVDSNPLLMAAAEGRRQVWVAMNQILGLSHREINTIERSIRESMDDGSGYV